MPDMIPLAYFLATQARPVEPGSDIWQSSLPLSRQPHKVANTPLFTYGDYFTAIGAFLEKDRYRAVKAALDDTLGAQADMQCVRALSVFLVKHGEFYHPARVVVQYGSDEMSFVVNGAISKTGRDHIQTEFKLLAALFPEFEPPAIPRVYLLDEISSGNKPSIPLFNAQWFEGFCEFHITADHPKTMSNLIVWGPDETTFFLTPAQAADVYRQAALILTTAYNFFTFEHISAWHHAAGDFILKPLDASRVALRLITIRKIAPLVENSAPDPAALIEALLLFFIHLTIRNRMDRLDGTGPLAWAEEVALEGTINGFFNGLGIIVNKADLPETFPADFKRYIQSHPKTALIELFFLVAGQIPDASPEVDFIQKRLKNHADLFCDLLAVGNEAEKGEIGTR